jgi:tetratricopeptide (TPR) repeat protein
LYREALEIWFKVLPAGHYEIAVGLASEGAVLKTMGKTKEANEIWDRIGQTYLQDLTKKRKVDGDTAALAKSLTSVGSFLQSAGRFDEAEVQYRDALAIRRKLLGEGSAEVSASLWRLTDLLQSQGRNADAQKLWRETVELRRATGSDPTNLAKALDALASVSKRPGKTPDVSGPVRADDETSDPQVKRPEAKAPASAPAEK